MIFRGQQASLRKESYRWLASFLCLWLCFAYLWLALFYPLMCAPYQSDERYGALDHVTAFEHTITPFTVVISAPIGWTSYLTPEASSNASWLLDSHDDTTGLAITFINVFSIPLVAWLNWVQPLRTITLLHSELYTQFRAAPPEEPPRFSF